MEASEVVQRVRDAVAETGCALVCLDPAHYDSDALCVDMAAEHGDRVRLWNRAFTPTWYGSVQARSVVNVRAISSPNEV